MASERIQRRIDGFLDEAEAAAARQEWNVVEGAARAILAIDEANEDAVAFLKMAAANLACSSQATTLWSALVMLTVAGLFHGVSLTLQQTLVQMLARNDMRGRTTSLFQMGFALMPIGVLPMGLAIDRWGAGPGIGTFFAVATVFFVAMAVFWRSLRSV